MSLDDHMVLEVALKVVSTIEEFQALAAVCVCALLASVIELTEIFQIHPKLAIFANTMKMAASDLVHTSILLISVVVAYAVCGNLYFGHQVEEFSTFSNTCFTLFAFMMGEFYDFAENMVEVDAVVRRVPQ